MNIEKEREAFEAWFLNKYQYSAEYFQITKFDADRGFYTAIDHYNPDSVNSAWVLRSSFDSWQAAKAQAVPEGFVLVPKKPDVGKALNIALKRIVPPPKTNDLIQKELMSKKYVDDLCSERDRILLNYEEMIEAQEQNQ